MRKKRLTVLFFIVFLAACDVITISRPDDTPPVPAGGIIIISPFDGQHFSLGDVIDVKTEVSGGTSAPSISLLIDGVIYRTDYFNSKFNNPHISQTWTPAEPGTYLVQTFITDGSGNLFNSTSITVIVDGATEQPQIEEETQPESEPEECPIPMASVTGYPFCRSGPGTAYNTVTSLQPGQSFPVVAISGSRSWWKIEYSTSGATCWVWDDLVDICGDTDDIEVVTGTEKDAEAPAEAPEEESKPEPKPEPEQEPTWDPSSGPTSP